MIKATHRQRQVIKEFKILLSQACGTCHRPPKSADWLRIMGRRKLLPEQKKAQSSLKAAPATLQVVDEIIAKLGFDIAPGTVNRLAHKIGVSVLEELLADDEMLGRLSEFHQRNQRERTRAKATHASRDTDE